MGYMTSLSEYVLILINCVIVLVDIEICKSHELCLWLIMVDSYLSTTTVTWDANGDARGKVRTYEILQYFIDFC